MNKALMLSVIEHEDGKVGLLPVMSSLGVVSSEAGSVFIQHDHRQRKLREQLKAKNKANFLNKKNAVLEKILR